MADDLCLHCFQSPKLQHLNRAGEFWKALQKCELSGIGAKESSDVKLVRQSFVTSQVTTDVAKAIHTWIRKGHTIENKTVHYDWNIKGYDATCGDSDTLVVQIALKVEGMDPVVGLIKQQCSRIALRGLGYPWGMYYHLSLRCAAARESISRCLSITCIGMERRCQDDLPSNKSNAAFQYTEFCFDRSLVFPYTAKQQVRHALGGEPIAGDPLKQLAILHVDYEKLRRRFGAQRMIAIMEEQTRQKKVARQQIIREELKEERRICEAVARHVPYYKRLREIVGLTDSVVFANTDELRRAIANPRCKWSGTGHPSTSYWRDLREDVKAEFRDYELRGNDIGSATHLLTQLCIVRLGSIAERCEAAEYLSLFREHTRITQNDFESHPYLQYFYGRFAHYIQHRAPSGEDVTEWLDRNSCTYSPEFEVALKQEFGCDLFAAGCQMWCLSKVVYFAYRFAFIVRALQDPDSFLGCWDGLAYASTRDLHAPYQALLEMAEAHRRFHGYALYLTGPQMRNAASETNLTRKVEQARVEALQSKFRTTCTDMDCEVPDFAVATHSDSDESHLDGCDSEADSSDGDVYDHNDLMGGDIEEFRKPMHAVKDMPRFLKKLDVKTLTKILEITHHCGCGGTASASRGVALVKQLMPKAPPIEWFSILLANAGAYYTRHGNSLLLQAIHMKCINLLGYRLMQKRERGTARRQAMNDRLAVIQNMHGDSEIGFFTRNDLSKIVSFSGPCVMSFAHTKIYIDGLFT